MCFNSRCAIISDAPANLKVKWMCFCVGIWQFLGESSSQWTLQFSHTTWELRIQNFELATEAILFILWADLHHNGNCWCICGMFSPGHCISNFWCGGKVVWGQENSNTLASSPMVVSKLGVKMVWNNTARPPRLTVPMSLSWSNKNVASLCATQHPVCSYQHSMSCARLHQLLESNACS